MTKYILAFVLAWSTGLGVASAQTPGAAPAAEPAAQASAAPAPAAATPITTADLKNMSAPKPEDRAKGDPGGIITGTVSDIPVSDMKKGLTLDDVVNAVGQNIIASNFIWTLVGNVGYAGAQWAIVIILAKLTTPEVVGEYALGLAMVTPVLMLVNLQLRTVLMTDVQQEYSFAHYLGFRLATTAAAMVCIAILGARMHGSWQHYVTIILIGIAQGVEAVSDIYYGLMQVRDRMDRIAISMIGRAVLSLAALAVTLWITRSLLWGIVALTVARLAVLAGYDARRRTHDPLPDEALSDFWPPRWSFPLQRKLCGFGLPLGIVALLLALNTMIPRYFLEASLGPRGVGIFAAIAFLPNSGSLLIYALGQSAFVPLARYYTKGDLAGFLRLLLQLLGIGLVLGLGGIAFAALSDVRC